ncbi:MAG: COG1615 family transporter [Clostridia bacterium]|nr:COG1615 family transporter [Clostridia bacterium]
MYTYEGEGGLEIGFFDKLCVGIREGNLGLLFSSGDSKIMTNRNVIKRAKKVIPYLMYDENPYLVIRRKWRTLLGNRCIYSIK